MFVVKEILFIFIKIYNGYKKLYLFNKNLSMLFLVICNNYVLLCI